MTGLLVAPQARFHGTDVRHHVPPNNSQCSRVSLDFRIGLGRFYDPKWRQQLNDSTGGSERATVQPRAST